MHHPSILRVSTRDQTSFDEQTQPLAKEVSYLEGLQPPSMGHPFAETFNRFHALVLKGMKGSQRQRKKKEAKDLFVREPDKGLSLS